MSTSRVVALVGGVLLAAGLLLGFLPISASGGNCGSAFAPSQSAAVDDLVYLMQGLRSPGREAACDEAVSARRAPALAVGTPGLLLLVGAGYAAAQAADRAKPKTTVRTALD